MASLVIHGPMLLNVFRCHCLIALSLMLSFSVHDTLLPQHILGEVAFVSQITNFSTEVAFQQELSSVSFRAFPLADEEVDLLVVEILGVGVQEVR